MSYGVSPSRRLFTISEKAVMLFKIMLIWILSNIKKTEKVNPNDEKLAGKKSRVWALSGFIMVPQGLLLLAKGSSSRLSGCNLTPRPVPLQGCPTKTAFPASWKKKKTLTTAYFGNYWFPDWTESWGTHSQSSWRSKSGSVSENSRTVPKPAPF